MTAALTTGTADTTIPGLSRRTVWHAPEVCSHSLLVLTPARLYLAPPGGRPGPEVVAAVENGADPEAVAGSPVTVVDLTSVRGAALDLTTNTLAVEYAAPQAGRVAVQFACAEAADAVFTKLGRRLGDRFALAPVRPDPWAAARGPVAALVGVLLATAAAALVLSTAEGSAPSSPWAAVAAWADWRVVCGVGGALLAVIQVRLYRRLTRPPAHLELLPR
jgi:hypothetical protein